VLLMSQAREVRGDDICEVDMGFKGTSSVALGDGGDVFSEASFFGEGDLRG
jgi:hypothetical protein